MNLTPALTLVVVGAALLIFGLDSTDSIPNSVSRLITGHPTDHTMWMNIVGGATALVCPSSCYCSRQD